jgi:hypothetical protein
MAYNGPGEGISVHGIDVTISKAVLEQFDELSARTDENLTSTRPTGKDQFGMSFQDIDSVISKI